MRKLVTALFAILVAAGPAAAQDNKPVDFNIGFGATIPTSGFKDSFDTGWKGSFGATFNINEHVGVQAEYSYLRMNGPERTINVSVTPSGPLSSTQLIESNQQMHVGSFDLVFKSQAPDRAVGGYVLGGAGIYHRMIQLTSPAVGYTTFCDPYWYVCYPAAVSVDNILGDRSSNDFGVDFGGGVTFGHEAKFYVEMRYHYVWGPTINSTASTLPAAAGVTNCSGGCSSNASYFPITFGVRW
jgi:opacity protein-like surface antigen